MDISFSQTGMIMVLLMLVANGASVLLRDIRANRRQPTPSKSNNRKVNKCR